MNTHSKEKKIYNRLLRERKKRKATLSQKRKALENNSGNEEVEEEKKRKNVRKQIMIKNYERKPIANIQIFH